MKITKQCPECGGREIYSHDVRVEGLLPFLKSPFALPGQNIECYICANCGYYQLFVPQDALPEVKKKYKQFN